MRLGENSQQQFKDFMILLFGIFVGIVLGVFLALVVLVSYSEYKASQIVISYTDVNGNLNTVRDIKSYYVENDKLTFTDKDGVVYSGIHNYTLIGE